MKHMFDCGIIDSDKKHKIRKADIIFLLVIVMTALIIFIIMRLNSTTGAYATVSYDGSAPLVQIPLKRSEPLYFLVTYQNIDTEIIGNENEYIQNTDGENICVNEDDVNIKEFSKEEWEEVWEEMQHTNVEYNVFLYKEQEISMLYGSCPDKICVHHRAISITGENIICLPHKLVIEITGNKADGSDGVAY